VSKSNAKIGVQKASVAEAFLGGYAYEDHDGNCVQSEAVTLTDACGNEVLGPRPSSSSIPVVETSLPSTLQLGKEYPISAFAVLVLPANAFRVTGLVQNTGDANIRVGPAGVTATTGYRLVPNQTIIYGEPNINKDDIWAIREGSVDSVAFAEEETIAISESASNLRPGPCTNPHHRHTCDDDDEAVA
jgi:hypothetical protein